MNSEQRSASTNMYKVASLICFLFVFWGTVAAQGQCMIYEKKGKYGILVKKNGDWKTALKPTYEAMRELGGLYNQSFIFKSKGKWGVIVADEYDLKTFITLEPVYDSLLYKIAPTNRDYSKGDGLIAAKDGKWTFIYFSKTSKKPAVPGFPFFDTIIYKEKSPVVLVKTNHLYGAFSLEGRELLPVSYASASSLTKDFTSNCYILKKPGDTELIIENVKTPGESFSRDLFIQKVDAIDEQAYSWVVNDKSFVLKENTIKEANDETLDITYRIIEEKSGFTIYRLGNNMGIKRTTTGEKFIEGHFDKIKYIGLNNGDNAFLLYDSTGLQCFNGQSKKIVPCTQKLISYWAEAGNLFLQTEEGRWNLFPNSITASSGYASLERINNNFIAYTSPEQALVFSGVASIPPKQVRIPANSKITDFRIYFTALVSNEVSFVYKINDHYGFQDMASGKILPPVFDDIQYYPYADGISLTLIYKGAAYIAKLYDIIYAGNRRSHFIKCNTISQKCGNPDCHFGVIGYSVYKTGGKTNTRVYDKLTLNGKLTIKETWTDPVVNHSEPIACKDPAHQIRTVVLYSNADNTGYDIKPMN
ncbi:MAG: hypothetical protein GC171_03210 [Terrimonas sp.]|nr:hypothetical protein [Terrimonas sp.]